MTRFAKVMIGVVAAAAALAAPRCGRTGAPPDDRLPGRSRPIMAHDWKHPRDFTFQPGTFTPPDPGQLTRTRSGVRAFVLTDSRETLVRLTAVMPLGRLFERSGEAGTSSYMSQVFANPGGASEGNALAARLASIGAQPHVEQWLDATRVSLEVLAEDWREGLAILVDLLREPPLDEASLAPYRTGAGYAPVLGGVDGPGFRPAVELQRLLAGYPLAPPDPGLTLSRARVRDLIARCVSAAAVIVGIAGNVRRKDAETALEDSTGGWVSGGKAPPPAALTARTMPAKVKMLDAPILEGWIAIGRVVDRVPPEERPALAVMADVLGTRLNIAAREIRGLANRNNFLLPQELDHGGLMHIRTGGRPEAVAPLVKVSLDEVRRLRAASDEISPEELEDAKGAVVRGKWQAALDGVRAASDTYALELLRHGTVERLLGWPDAVRAVTAAQVKAAAWRYLDPAQMATVVVGPLDKIRTARHPRWPASIDEPGAK